MSYIKIWIHAVWTVKNRQAILNHELRQKIFTHIHQNVLQKDILMEVVNGHNNHVHCLFRLKNDQTIEKVMQLIKGESSYWFNKNNLSKLKLIWQKEYFAVSVSESHVDVVNAYIKNQENIIKRKPGRRNTKNL